MEAVDSWLIIIVRLTVILISDKCTFYFDLRQNKTVPTPVQWEGSVSSYLCNELHEIALWSSTSSTYLKDSVKQVIVKLKVVYKLTSRQYNRFYPSIWFPFAADNWRFIMVISPSAITFLMRSHSLSAISIMHYITKVVHHLQSFHRLSAESVKYFHTHFYSFWDIH